MNTSKLLICSQAKEFISKINKLDQYTLETISELDSIDLEVIYPHKVVIIDGRNMSKTQLAGNCQVASQVVVNSQVVLVVDNKMSIEDIKFLYKSGVNLILAETDFFNSQKLDFFINNHLHNEYYPVKSYDFTVDTTPEFKVYHFLAWKGNFVPVIYGSIDAKKLEKISTVNELYIKREDVDKYSRYISQGGPSKDKVLSRCRGKYLSFYENYIQLLFKITDDTKHYSFEEGRKLLEETKAMAQDLLNTLATVEDPWLIVNNFSQESNNFLLARAPVAAAYAGILALELQLSNPEEIMLAALIGDVGLLSLPYENDSDYLEKYHNHPLKSINLVLERKLPLDENIKKIILFSHENLQRTGFPKGKEVNPDKIPLESQLIQICQKLDNGLMIKKGQLRPNLIEVKEKLVDELSKNHLFNLSLILKLKSLWFNKAA